MSNDFWAEATGVNAIEYIEEDDFELSDTTKAGIECVICGLTDDDEDSFVSDGQDIYICLDCTYKFEK